MTFAKTSKTSDTAFTPARDIARLLDIMAALRTPKTGCPWDLEQNFSTIAPYTIEEAYEVADAIARDDLADLKDELGDLLLQVVFHARMAEEQGAFDFGDVVEAITSVAVLRKIREEVDEIEAALEGDETPAAAEVGDLLFAAVNLARHLNADPETVLRQTNRKFERRFAGIERALAARGKKPQDATLAEMDVLWDEAKAQE